MVTPKASLPRAVHCHRTNVQRAALRVKRLELITDGPSVLGPQVARRNHACAFNLQRTSG
jgi:hypothetical protein